MFKTACYMKPEKIVSHIEQEKLPELPPFVIDQNNKMGTLGR
jgi:hypothetical protein